MSLLDIILHLLLIIMKAIRPSARLYTAKLHSTHLQRPPQHTFAEDTPPRVAIPRTQSSPVTTMPVGDKPTMAVV